MTVAAFLNLLDQFPEGPIADFRIHVEKLSSRQTAQTGSWVIMEVFKFTAEDAFMWHFDMPGWLSWQAVILYRTARSSSWACCSVLWVCFALFLAQPHTPPLAECSYKSGGERVAVPAPQPLRAGLVQPIVLAGSGALAEVTAGYFSVAAVSATIPLSALCLETCTKHH